MASSGEDDTFSNGEEEQIKRERHNAHKYRKLYSELLKKHQGVLHDAWKGATTANTTSSSSNGSSSCTTSNEFADNTNHTDDDTSSFSSTTTTPPPPPMMVTESRLIQDMWVSERNAIAVGLVCGCAMLATTRFLPSILIRRLGGDKKVQAVRQADEEAKKLGIYKYQRAFTWIVESGFAVWVANRAYHYHSKNNSNEAYDTLAKIPLCSGRSVIADNVCEEWVNITTKQIPRTFWKNLDIKDDDDGLHDERAWRTIREFSNSCVKRRAYQRQLASKSVDGAAAPVEDNDDDMAQPVSLVLATEVPNDILLSKSEAEQLVQDRSTSSS